MDIKQLFSALQQLQGGDVALSHAARFIYLLLVMHRNPETGKCFPSVKLLSTESGYSRPCVIHALAELEDAGAMQTVRKPGLSSSYTIAPLPVKPLYQLKEFTGKPALPPPVKPLYSTSKPALPEIAINREVKLRVCTPRPGFTKPSPEEVRAYAKDIGGNDSMADSFFDHFEANGWKVGGKSAMKDWQAAFRNWQRNETKYRSNIYRGAAGARTACNPQHVSFVKD